MRTRNLALLAAAALAATGCASTPRLAPGALGAKSTVVINTIRNSAGNWECATFPKTVVVEDSSGAGFDDQVTWVRVGDDSGKVDFKLRNAADKTIFPDLEIPMPDRRTEKKSGKPQSNPAAGHLVGYTVKWKGATCDPDICIRKNGTGCDGFMTR